MLKSTILMASLLFIFQGCNFDEGDDNETLSITQDTTLQTSSITSSTPISKATLLGDLDNDGVITWDDINKVYWYFGEEGDDNYNPEADIDQNGVVNASDADLLHEIMNGLVVSSASISSSSTSETSTSAISVSSASSSEAALLGDLDKDGVITWDDINKVYWYFGSVGDDNYNVEADINKNGVVNAEDAELLKAIMDGVSISSIATSSDTTSNSSAVSSTQSSSNSSVAFVDYTHKRDYSFIVFGDFNGGGCDKLSRINEAITMMASEDNIDFFASTGDIIDGYLESNPTGESAACFGRNPLEYNIGVSTCNNGVDDGNMHSIIAPINERDAVEGLKSSFYLALGNHDDNWGSNWYPDPCGGGICDLLAPRTPADFINHAFDSEGICSVNQATSTYPTNFYYSFDFQDAKFIFLRMNNDYGGFFSCNGGGDCEAICSDVNAEADRVADGYSQCYNAKQYDWLRHELESAKQNDAKHIFVFAHAPLVTSSENHPPVAGNGPTRALLEQYNVDVFFNGHNHSYERTYPLKGGAIDSKGTRYITTGSAGAHVYGVLGDSFTEFSSGDFVPYGSNDYARKMTTYLKMDVNATHVHGEVRSIGLDGVIVDEFSYIKGSESTSSSSSQNSSAQNSSSQSSSSSVASNANGLTLIEGCDIFPSDSIWNTKIDGLEVHPLSSTYIANAGNTLPIHPDFGTIWNGTHLGIEYDIIDSTVAMKEVSFTWADETDPLTLDATSKPYPIPENPSIEGGSDNHILLLEKDNCMLYEIFNASLNNGTWHGDSGAIWDLSKNEIRPEGVTSADASGLAILPGLVRYEEVYGDSAIGVEAGINHALRVTFSSIQSAYIRPASHSDGQAGQNRSLIPMGLRLRLKAGFDISGFSEPIQVILSAMKTYGIIIADTGGDLFLSGTYDERWDDDALRNLNGVSFSDFEAVYTGELVDY